MATKTWTLRQINVGGTNPDRLWWDEDTSNIPAQTTSATGWLVAKTGANNYRVLAQGQEVAGFTTTVAPNNTAPAVDNSYASTTTYTPPTLLSDVESISTLYEYNASFPAGTWTFNFPVIAVSFGGSQDGQLRMRVFKGTRSGTSWTGVTELTTSANPPLTATAAVSNLTAVATQTNTITWSAPAFTLNNEFLICKLAWQITGAGGNNSCDVLLRYGSGATMISPSFRKRSYNIT